MGLFKDCHSFLRTISSVRSFERFNAITRSAIIRVVKKISQTWLSVNPMVVRERYCPGSTTARVADISPAFLSKSSRAMKYAGKTMSAPIAAGKYAPTVLIVS